MANWSKNKTLPANINGGNEYAVDDNVVLEELNAITTNSFYAMDKAEEAYTEAHSAFMNNGTVVSVNNVPQLSMSFDSDPQTQIKQLSNPNLLINGDFRVNQRGKEDYTNSTSNTTYTVDRWRISLGNSGLNGTVVTPKTNGSVNLTGGVNLTCSNAYAGGATPFIQVLENPQNLIGKTLTFSVYISAINSGSCRYRLSNYTTFETGNLAVGLNTVTYTVPSGTTQIFCGIICNATTAFDIDIEYMKLEVGSVATPFSPRPYAEELALCQRYYQHCKIQGATVAGAGSTKTYPAISLATSMRTYHTLENITLPSMRGQGSAETVSSIAHSVLNDNRLQLEVISPTNKTSFEIYVLVNGSFDVDCEIY